MSCQSTLWFHKTYFAEIEGWMDFFLGFFVPTFQRIQGLQRAWKDIRYIRLGFSDIESDKTKIQ